ncbi:hypothetical protein GEMRC1_009713 [Eukaryota sp. GEM-RC1]
MTNICYFWKTHHPFSQWHPSVFTVDGVQYNCCEQYMMARKALLFNDQTTYNKIMSASSPARQKALGRKVSPYDDQTWVKHREQIIFDGNYAKFSQNEELKKFILDTGDSTIAEASPYDKIYGIGLTEEQALTGQKWQGLNLLGVCLENVRQKLRNESLTA